MTTTISRLAAALAALDAAVGCCLAVGLLPADTPAEVRRQAADVAVTDYEAADAVVEALLGYILAEGGCPGLLQALSAAASRAAERAGQPLGARARAVAQHAYGRALSREQQVIAEVALPYWRNRVEVAS